MEKLLDYFRPDKYILDLFVEKKEKKHSGSVIIEGEAKAEKIKFHAVDFEIYEVLVDGENTKFGYDGKEITVGVVPGPRTILIKFSRKLNENMQGAYLSTYEHNGKTEIVVATQFESHYAREAFPCIDEPAAKAVFELTIIANEDDLVLSNTPKLASRLAPRPSGPSPRADGANSRAAALRNAPKNYLASTFEPTPRMSTYLLAWVIGKFHGKTIKNAYGTEITTYVALNQDVNSVDFANDVAAKSLEFYDDNFGVAYPLKKLDQVALPDFEAGAMENWGLVTYRESMLIAGKDATLSTKKGVALTVAHELSHQWFGDLVTMQWWDDLWLNESFASVMEYFAVDAAYPEFKIFEGFFTGDSLAALRRDCLSGVQSVHQDVNNPEEIATLFDPAIVYAKGARLMLMVIRAMGWDKFCAGIREYFEEYKYGNTIGDNLWDALNPYADFDVKKMMHAFIDKPGYPVIMDGKQKRFLLDGPMEVENWPIPEITEDMSGHYILNLTDAEFEERLSRFDTLNLEEKLRLLIDRDLLSKTDLSSSAPLLPLLKKFKNENSAAVWNIIVTIVGTLKVFFEYKTEEEKKFKEFVRELVDAKLSEVGICTREGDDENIIRLRANLLALDYFAEDLPRIEKLAGMYNADYAAMDAEIRDDILDAKIYVEPELIDKYIEDYIEISDPEIKFDLLFAATLSRDDVVVDKMVGLLSQPEIVKPQDHFHLFIYMYRNPAAKEKVWDWLTRNWDYVKKIAGDKSLEDYPRYTAASIKTQKDFDKYLEFFEPMADDPALSRAIEVGKNEIRARLALIEADKKEVYETLE